jgi:hypothetical protein
MLNDPQRFDQRLGHLDFGIPSDFVIRPSDLAIAVEGKPPFEFSDAFSGRLLPPFLRDARSTPSR